MEEAITAGIASRDFFGYAFSKNNEGYEGLIFGEPGNVFIDQQSLLIKPEAATAQQDKQKPTAIDTGSGTSVEETYTDDTTGTDTPSGTHTTPSPYATPVSKGYKRFHGSVNLDPITMGLDAAKIAEEVIQHFTLESGTEVNIRLEIEAFTPKGISDKTVRIIRENSRSLNFQVNEFETE